MPEERPEEHEERVELLLDMIALAFQTDTTRVSTFMFGKEVSGRSFPEIGVPGGHHGHWRTRARTRSTRRRQRAAARIVRGTGALPGAGP